MKFREIFIAVFLSVAALPGFAETYYVSKNGDDSNEGTSAAPFATINASAQIAMPGDTIIVHGGVYREWVSPARGGTSEEDRIIYQAAEGETVIIAGSELVRGWVKEDNLWRVDIKDEDIGVFKEEIRHPIYVEVDESGDGWGWLKYGRWAHRGDVIYRGQGLTEKEKRSDLSTAYSWYIESADGGSTVWANFGDEDPNESGVELALRPYAFYPTTPGLNYITLKGIVVANVATHWAPPTVPQPGAIGTNGGSHWVIEDNAVIHSRTLAISIGNPTSEADLTKAGSHVIQNNILLRNGQGGVAGQSWNHDSVIQGNWIEDTNYRKEFGGWETSAIKIHNADNVLIEGNIIRNVGTADSEIGAAHGIWIDFQNKNVRVTRNVIADAEAASILTEANWDGPVLIDNNVVFGGELSTYSSRSDVWVHNLFVDAMGRWENQDWGDRIPVSNSRWIRNAFVGLGLDGLPSDTPDTLVSENLYLSGAKPSALDQDQLDSASTASFSLNWTQPFSVSFAAHLPDAFVVQRTPTLDVMSFDHPSLCDFKPAPVVTDLLSLDVSLDAVEHDRAVSDFPYGPFGQLPIGEPLKMGVAAPAAQLESVQSILANGVAAFER